MITCVMEVGVRDYGLSESDVEQLWARCAEGESFHTIARTLGKPHHHLRRYLALKLH
jgi:hypothetical protein